MLITDEQVHDNLFFKINEIKHHEDAGNPIFHVSHVTLLAYN